MNSLNMVWEMYQLNRNRAGAIHRYMMEVLRDMEVLSVAKNSATYTDHGASFFNGEFPVAAHANGELVK